MDLFACSTWHSKADSASAAATPPVAEAAVSSTALSNAANSVGGYTAGTLGAMMHDCVKWGFTGQQALKQAQEWQTVFWSRLAKSLHSQKVSVTWAEEMNKKLASVLVPEKMSWATAMRSIRKCKTRIEKIGGSRVDTEPNAWGLDVHVWNLLWTGEEAMQKGIPILKRAGFESV